MTKNNSKDLTVGSPTGLILGFSLPLLLGMLASAFSSSASVRVCVQAFHFL